LRSGSARKFERASPFHKLVTDDDELLCDVSIVSIVGDASATRRQMPQIFGNSKGHVRLHSHQPIDWCGVSRSR